MKTLEKVLGLLLMVGFILKLALISGSSILIVLPLLILSGIYFYLGFAFFNDIPLKVLFKKESYANISLFRILGTIGFGFSLSLITIGILFKIQLWKGANLDLLIGLVLISIITIVSLIKFLKNKDKFYNRIFARIIIIGGFGLLFLLTPEIKILKLQYRNHPRYIEAYEAYKKDPQNIELRKNLKKEYDRIKMPKEVFNNYYKENK